MPRREAKMFVIGSHRVRRLAVTALTLGMLAATACRVSAQEAAATTLEGTLSIVWGDPRHGHEGGETRFELVKADGDVVRLSVDEKDQPAAYAAFGKPVTVTGRASAAEGVEPSLRAETIALRAPADAAIVPQVTTTTRKVLYILVKFKGDTQTPHSAGFYTALTNPKTASTTYKIPATINGYFDKSSWGQLQWQGTVAGNKWFTLPKTKTGYANCGWSGACAQLTQLGNDAVALAKGAGVDVSKYDNISFVVNNDLDCCAWGGSFSYGGKVFGATWEPPWGQETGTYVHEYGHSIGLPHSGWKYYAYDSPWDEMSTGSTTQYVQCATYKSANDGGASRAVYCTEPGAGYITAHQDYKGWLPTANKVTISTTTTRTVTLDANARPLGSAVKMIKICIPGAACTGSSAHFLTVETKRRLVQYEKGLPGDGVVIHDVQMNRGPVGSGNPCFFNTQSGWAMPIDATNGDWRGQPYCDAGGRTFPNYALFNAQYVPGKTYSNTTWGIKVEVLSKTTYGYSVRVTRSK